VNRERYTWRGSLGRERRCIASIDIELLSIFQRIQLAWGLLRDERVAGWIKKAGLAMILAYVVSPIDVVPDFLIGPGQVDDLGVIAVGLVILIRLLVRFAPDEVVAEHVANITGNRTGYRPGFERAAGDPIDTSGRVRR
jgi:uncharacterized membrane protein YkvA (DUF1232 family)